mmetsp:Transcript_14997/g.22892  ORF Transcript_14997/g.22892 Transcript_14997/m.22892 type:complete len:1029 (-) Transcript_14997:62-3148(-)
MKNLIKSVAFILLLLVLANLSSPQQTCQDNLALENENRCEKTSAPVTKLSFKFLSEGNKTICQYWDPNNGNVNIHVPKFVSSLPAERIAQELSYYLRSNGLWSQRLVLESLFHSLTYGVDYKPQNYDHPGFPCLGSKAHWLDSNVNICRWEGVTCGNIHPFPKDRPRIEQKLFGGKVQGDYDWGPAEEHKWPSAQSVTKLDLAELKCQGTLPDELYMLTQLRRLDLSRNSLRGTIPDTFSDFSKLEFLDLSHNLLTGSPRNLSQLSVEELWLEHNQFHGPIHYFLIRTPIIRYLDVSHNKLTGAIPSDIAQLRPNLMGFFAEHNEISGKIVPSFGGFRQLSYLRLDFNKFEGTIPTEIGLLENLRLFQMNNNRLNGTLPIELTGMRQLETLLLSSNRLSGPIPVDDGETQFQWSNLLLLKQLTIDNNNLTGTLPPSFVLGISSSLTSLNLGLNSIAGTLPPELGRMKHVAKLNLPRNDFEGTIPFELGRLLELKELNLTSNRLEGTIPRGLCDEGRVNNFVQFYSCNAILCPAGTFHIDGAANSQGACRSCPTSKDSTSKLLGQTNCDAEKFLIGDMDGDGRQSPREMLVLFYMQNSGLTWGEKFSSWINTAVTNCELPGITCVGFEIAKIDLSDAQICTDQNGKQVPPDQCRGIPSELALLSNLEVIALPRRQFLRGSIPTEIGTLSKLRYLDLSHCPAMTGSIPSEIGILTHMKVLNLANSRFTGTIPSDLFHLTQLEKLHLSANRFTGTIPQQVGNAKSLREFMISRLLLKGTIPTSIGKLTLMENFELYGSSIEGTIPKEIGRCSNLKRLDAFNNKLTGVIPPTLGQIESLQIIHLKKNQLTGKLPEEIGNLKFVSWIDASSNILSGSIPNTYGNNRMIKDLRLGGNRLHAPIPSSLCNSNKINGGRTRSYGCDAILCPLGYYDATGYANDSNGGCTKCPDGKTTIYLGSTSCVELHPEDILSMFYDVMGGELWDQSEVYRWKSDMGICNWNGVVCEEDGTLVSLSFPLTQADQATTPPPLSAP